MEQAACQTPSSLAVSIPMPLSPSAVPADARQLLSARQAQCGTKSWSLPSSCPPAICRRASMCKSGTRLSPKTSSSLRLPLRYPGCLQADVQSRKKRIQVANLLRPKGDDGGVFQYSIALASVERLEAHVQVLETLERIPMLPKIHTILSSVQRRLADLPAMLMRARKGFADLPTLRQAFVIIQKEAEGWKVQALESVDKTSILTRVSSFSLASLRIAAGVAQSTLEKLKCVVQ